jgi:hypothetical protein
MLTIQTTIAPEVKTVFNNGQLIGEIIDRNTFFEAVHISGGKGVFNSFDAAKKLFEEVIKPNTIKRNNQLNLF